MSWPWLSYLEGRAFGRVLFWAANRRKFTQITLVFFDFDLIFRFWRVSAFG
jgi:hypothetical protein